MEDLEQFKNEMNLTGKNVYVGHRYVPKIFGEWDNTKTYEALSIVQYQGNSFTSRQIVPVGIDINNEEFWASTGNYNAQIEQYRQDVRNTNETLTNLITTNNAKFTALDETISDLQTDVTTLDTKLSSLNTVNISEFGAVGDGITDDYDAFIAAANYFKDKGTGTLILEPKTYLLDRYRIVGGENQNDVENIFFEDVVGFTLEGNGATILKKGDFNRTYDFDASGNKYSYVQGLSIIFETCDNLTIRNLTVDGQVQQTTRDTGVLEDGGYGIRLSGSRNVILENVNSNNHTMDGFALMPSDKKYDGIKRICRNIRLINCSSLRNARQGLTAGHFVGLYVENCDFSETGKAAGTYGRVFPGLGIDFEMDYPVNAVEEASKGAVIKDTRINNNFNTVSIFNNLWEDISFIDCEMKNDYEGTLYDINLNGRNVKLVNCDIDILGIIFLGNPVDNISEATLKDCVINCGNLRAFESANLIVKLIDNTITGSVYINVVNKNSFTVGNLFTAKASKKTGDTYMIYWRLKYLAFSRDNTFITDLTTVDAFFSNDYANTNVVVGDVYTTDNVRPAWNSAAGIRLYNKGVG